MATVEQILDNIESAKDFKMQNQPESVKVSPGSNINVVKKIYPTDSFTLTPSEVFAARDTVIQKDVILKKILKSKLDEYGKESAVQEQKLQVSLQHPNVVSGYECYETEEAYCIVMEFLEQADYFKIKLIENYKPIKNDTKIKMYLTDVLNGLKYIHDQDLVHLDLKLENLYCYRYEVNSELSIRKVKIGDFGIAQKVDSQKKSVEVKSAMGTRDYMAPEIKNNSEISQAVDIWSLGVILYQICTGYFPTQVKGFQYEQDHEIPFRKRDWKKIQGQKDIQELIIRMLQFDPKNRPTVDELLNDPFIKKQD